MKRYLMGALVLMLGVSAAASEVRIGTVTDSPAEDIEEFKIMTEHLAGMLSDEGVTEVRPVMAASMDEMAAMLADGEIDFYIDSPFPAVVVSRMSGGEPVLRRWKKGVAEYSSVLFVRADSEIQSEEDLPGRIIAFEEPFSSSGYMLPTMALQDAGYTMKEKRTPKSYVRDSEIGYIFSGDDANTVAWVLLGQVEVGATNHVEFEAEAGDKEADLRVVYQTQPIPRQVVVVRSDMDAALRQSVLAALKSMHETEEGVAALQGWEKTKKLDDLPQSFFDETMPMMSAFVEEHFDLPPVEEQPVEAATAEVSQ